MSDTHNFCVKSEFPEKSHSKFLHDAKRRRLQVKNIFVILEKREKSHSPEIRLVKSITG